MRGQSDGEDLGVVIRRRRLARKRRSFRYATAAGLCVAVALIGWRLAGAERKDDGTPPPGRADGAIDLRGKTIVEFIDHPDRFKGKSLRGLLTVMSPVRGGDSLRNYRNRDVLFRCAEGRDQLDLRIRMPDKDLPNAHAFDQLVVTFVCKDGELLTGNEAVAVDRATPR